MLCECVPFLGLYSKTKMAAIRDVSSLPIPEEVIVKLYNKGFRVVQDLVGVRPLELANEISVELTMAVSVLQAVKNATSSGNYVASSSSGAPDRMTAQELLDRLSIDRPIITFSKPLDSMLGGGIQCGQITEICGPPGVSYLFACKVLCFCSFTSSLNTQKVGKTQLAIQLSLTCQIPEIFNGNNGECICIDTEGSFLPERVVDMAQEISHHLKKLALISLKHKTQEVYLAQQAAAENMSVERFLQGIHIFRVHSSTELLATIKNLSNFLQLHPRIKLIIIDSIAFPFRAEIHDISSRNRSLAALGQTLGNLSFMHRTAIVLTNHVTTRITPNVAQNVQSVGQVSEGNLDSGSGKGKLLIVS